MGHPAFSSVHADLERGSLEYEKLKEERSQVLWKAVERVIPDIRQRTHIEMVHFPKMTLCAWTRPASVQ